MRPWYVFSPQIHSLRSLSNATASLLNAYPAAAILTDEQTDDGSEYKVSEQDDDETIFDGDADIYDEPVEEALSDEYVYNSTSSSNGYEDRSYVKEEYEDGDYNFGEALPHPTHLSGYMPTFEAATEVRF